MISKGRRSETGFINFSSLRNNTAKQSDPSLAWIMFYKIAHMYRYITKQETDQESLLIQGLHVNFESAKAAGASPATLNVSIPLH